MKRNLGRAVPVSESQLDCQDADRWLGAALDSELASEDALLLEHHLTRCGACRSASERMSAVRSALRAAVQDDRAPDALVQSLRAQLSTEQQGRSRRRSLGVACAAVLVGGALVLAHQLAPAARPDSRLDRLVEGSIERHTLDVPVDVASPDPVRVAAFLASRVGGGLVVPRLDALGFGLQGARVVDLGERRVAQLIYTGGLGQRVSVLAIPDGDGALSELLGRFAPQTDRGLAVQLVHRGPTLYAVVGAVEPARLGALARSIEASAAVHPIAVVAASAPIDGSL